MPTPALPQTPDEHITRGLAHLESAHDQAQPAKTRARNAALATAHLTASAALSWQQAEQLERVTRERDDLLDADRVLGGVAGQVLADVRRVLEADGWVIGSDQSLVAAVQMLVQQRTDAVQERTDTRRQLDQLRGNLQQVLDDAGAPARGALSERVQAVVEQRDDARAQVDRRAETITRDQVEAYLVGPREAAYVTDGSRYPTGAVARFNAATERLAREQPLDVSTPAELAARRDGDATVTEVEGQAQ